ncbi:MAG: hypothetical protein Phyf2KO_00840 [Phycisphaerales bacterium]
MSDQVGQIIREEGRANEVRARLAAWDRLIAELERQDAEYRAVLATLNADPATTRADLAEAVEPFDRERRAILTRIMDERDAIISLTTQEEWIALGGIS